MYLLIYATILPILIQNILGNTDINDKSMPVEVKVMDISTPAGFYREQAINGSFAHWLRQVSLKKDKTVYLYNGTIKPNQHAQYAVLDIRTGEKDLQQCADAVMRLRSEFLYFNGRFSEIVFFDNLKRPYQFQLPYTRANFERYLEKVFSWCGTLSLEKQLKPISDYSAVAAGEVFIHGGSPGHAAIIIDIAVNNRNEKVFLMAQSYMPAQDIHILQNPNDPGLSPWYKLPEKDQMITPEWVFHRKERKQW
jgi:predicted small secreted protein